MSENTTFIYEEERDHMLRFGLDIGIASVGWAVVDDDYRVLESGSNIFEAADAEKNGNRREFRQHKRLLRRRRTRLQDYGRVLRGMFLMVSVIFSWNFAIKDCPSNCRRKNFIMY